jgi:hypothetical protein
MSTLLDILGDITSTYTLHNHAPMYERHDYILVDTENCRYEIIGLIGLKRKKIPIDVLKLLTFISHNL